jgi:hypothetical protein
MLTLNVPGRCKEETPINAKRSHYDRMLLDDDTIVAVGTHQWRIGAYHIADGLRLPVDSIERRHGYQRSLLNLSLFQLKNEPEGEGNRQLRKAPFLV